MVLLNIFKQFNFVSFYVIISYFTYFTEFEENLETDFNKFNIH